MTLTIATDPVPLATDESGVIRVGGTRVTLDTIVETFNEGASAEEIALRFPAVTLSDIYDVIAYYLHHKPEVDEYLRQQDIEAEQIRRENEARFNLVGIRQRLLARRATQNSGA